MVTITEDRRNELSTWHQTGPYPVTSRWVLRQQGPEGFTLHNESVLKVQELLAQCNKRGQRFRAYGSLWSLNDIAFNGGWVLNNTDMDMRLALTPGNMHSESALTHDNLVFVQCGTTVNQLTSYLEGRGKSLKVSGGSNGQTIAGATSTGVHGGAFDRQCLSDYIAGMHLIIGDAPGDRIYLERASEPVLNDEFAQMLGSRIVCDDDVFNAAIVGLGSFGFIAAIVMEVEDIFSLRRYVRSIKYNDAILLSQTLDFENSDFKITGEVDAHNKPIRPFHFKTYINQFTKDCVAEIIYKIPYQNTVYPEAEISSQLHPDLFRLMRWALEKSEMKVTNLLTRLIQGTAMPNPGKNTTPLVGTLGDIFRSVSYQQPGFSWALGVNQSQLDRAIETWLGIFKHHKAPGLSAIKLVRKTNATLGFHKFPVTAVIHMDGVQWLPTGDQLRVQQEILKAFIRDGIDFTLHWGKNAAWDYPSLMEFMYPTEKDEWIKQRSRLLRPEMAAMFSNDFLKRLGLDAYVNDLEAIV
ncbi:MAG: FAD-binding protein [Bacteroidota bacterium]